VCGTLFITATALITTLGRALAESRLEERLEVLTQPQLLIVDETGYLPIDRPGANLFFQQVSRRYAFTGVGYLIECSARFVLKSLRSEPPSPSMCSGRGAPKSW
jgi:hypothetical protein